MKKLIEGLKVLFEVSRPAILVLAGLIFWLLKVSRTVPFRLYWQIFIAAVIATIIVSYIKKGKDEAKTKPKPPKLRPGNYPKIK